jgi:hypothetical protein
VLEGGVEVSKPLGEEPRRLVPEGVDLEGTVLDLRLKPTGGSIKLPTFVVTYAGREELFGSKEPREYDHTVAPMKFKTRRVLVPYIPCFRIVSGRPVLNMVLFRADNVVRVAERYREELATAADLQRSVNRYYDQIERMLCGKSGLLTRHMFGVRCANSLRFVAVPEPDLRYFEIGVPEHLAVEATISTGDWVIAMRSPVLWQGSVLAMKAVRVDSHAGMANPFIMKGLGLDFDGDTMAVIKADTDDAVVLDEMRNAVGDPTIETFEFEDEFLVNNPDPECNWEQASVDVAARLAPTGLSLGPEDVLNPEESEFLGICNNGIKDVPDDFVEYAHGISADKWVKETERAAVEVTKLKLEIGLLGACTDKVNQVLLAFDPDLLPLGLQLKERLTDLMMKNAKQGLGTGYTTAKITAMLDRRGAFKEASVETALEYMQQIGFDPVEYQPVIELLYDMQGGTKAVKNHLAILQVCRTRDRRAMLKVLAGNWGYASIAARIHEYRQEGGDENQGLIPHKGIHTAGRKRQRGGRSLRPGLQG